MTRSQFQPSILALRSCDAAGASAWMHDAWMHDDAWDGCNIAESKKPRRVISYSLEFPKVVAMAARTSWIGFQSLSCKRNLSFASSLGEPRKTLEDRRISHGKTTTRTTPIKGMIHSQAVGEAITESDVCTILRTIKEFRVIVHTAISLWNKAPGTLFSRITS